MADVNPSATTAAKPPAHLTPQEMTPAQLRDWELTGNAPDREPSPDTKEAPVDQPAEAAAAEPEQQAASTDATQTAVSETAKPDKKAGKKLNARERAEELEREAAADERRLQEALRRRREIRDRLAEAEREEPAPKQADKKTEAASEAAAVEAAPSWKKYRSLPGAPKASDFAGPEALDDYAAAVTAFVGAQVAKETFATMFDERAAKDREAAASESEFVALVEEAASRVEAELEADPDIITRIDDRWKRLNPVNRLAEGERLTPAHHVKDRVMFHSKHSLKLSEWLTKDGGKELARIAQLRPDQVIREIAFQDAKFDLAEESGEATGERPSRVSKAPAPAPALGKKAAQGVDPVKQAIAANDFETFNRLEFERERSGR